MLYQQNDIIPVWDKLAGSYDSNIYWGKPENYANLQVLLDQIGNPVDKSIIEVGCGGGLVSVALAKKGAHCTLLDISNQSLKAAINSFIDEGLPEPVSYLADALDSNIHSETFDVVWNAGVIEHFFDKGKERLINEMLRITKPGGKVVILVPNTWCLVFQVIQRWQKWNKIWPYGYEDDMSPWRLKMLAKTLGINNFRVFAFNPILGWTWLNKVRKIIKLFGFDTIKNHSKRSLFGFMSVMVIEKS